MSSQSSKRWKDPTDYWNIRLFKSLTYRTEEGLPIIKAYTGEIPSILIPANISAGEEIKTIPKNKREGFAHFYLDDYQFERFWNYPIRYTKYLKTFLGTLSPDYSVFSDYPKIIQKMNIFRSRALGAYWNMCGIPVIPSISWNTYESFEWCFEGIEENSIVSISTVGSLRSKKLKEVLIIGYSEMIYRLKPSKVVIYGRYPEELDAFNVENIRIKSFHEKFETEERKIKIDNK